MEIEKINPFVYVLPVMIPRKTISLAGTDLPDDDYTTLVPRPKSVGVNNRKMPMIVEDKESK